jgi:general stress protein 26
MSHAMKDDQARIKLRDLIENIRLVMLVTTGADGLMQARPMTVLAVEDDTVWFFADANSPKMFEIGQDHAVLLTAANPASQDFVSARGVARVVEDMAKKQQLWTEIARLWFPEGVKSPNLVLIGVDLVGAEYWDSAASAARLVYGYVRALVGQTVPQLGENGKVRFQAD